MKQREKGSIIIVVLIILVLVGAGVYFFSQRKSSTSQSSEAISTTTPTGERVEIPEEYVVVEESSAHEARLKFKVALDEKTLTKENISVCVSSASVGSSGESDCEAWDKYEFSYDRAKNILTISELNIDPDDRGRFGIFGSGCASCMHEVKLDGLKTKEGVVLLTKSILVY